MAWPPLRDAVHTEVVKSEASPQSVLVEHFNDPFEIDIADDSDAALRKAAHEYVKALCAVPFIAADVQLPPHWRVALEPGNDSHPLFGWLPFDDPKPPAHQTGSGPRGSFRSALRWDQVAVLFAGDRVGKNDYLGSGFGLALATRVRKDGGQWKASFLGMSAALPYGDWKWVPSTSRLAALAATFAIDNLFRSTAAVSTMESVATLEGVAIRGVRIAASPSELWIERRGIGVRCIAGVEVPHAVTMLTTGIDASSMTDSITHVAALVADAAGDTPVFDQDPSSAAGKLVKPTRKDLAKGRVPEPILPPGVPNGPLEYPPDAATPLLQIMCCPRFVEADRPAKKPPAVKHVSVNAGDPAVISDDATAIQAFRHARELVQRLQAYGWSPENYFRLTAPEIRIFYRSGISPGPGKDGRTVNARVIPDGWPANAIRWNGPRPAINIHLAWADLRVRARGTWTAGGPASPAIPMGIAIDKRWMWHEFGHVLLVASTGELEFRFAHSPGDAMAAIASDPDSLLQDARRGLTFPFVFIPRLHNRCAAHGWSWTGTMHQALKDVPDALQPRRKGYASEQILSSSLFRLYRCIGGDAIGLRAPAGNHDERRRASHYTLYLIMQAMQLMGDARIQATSTPAKFVHWLRQAERHSDPWKITWNQENYTRVGGTLGKVIRWAFEAQGLYGSGNGLGSPDKVDIYIKSCRPTIDASMGGATDFGPGSYVPVSLHWQAADVEEPRWQADPENGITYSIANGRVEVRVGNRGDVESSEVQVRLWVAAWPANAKPPEWLDGTWSQCTRVGAGGPITIPRKTLPGEQVFTFDLPTNPPLAAGRHILLAEASCDQDRPNTDPSLLLACATQRTPLVDLVANDNNLGLLVVNIDP